jgi:anaerobic selenocysteine-containing dehydrogenase
LWLLSGGILFLQGEASRRGTLLPKLAKGSRAFFHPEDAKRLKLEAEDAVELTGPSGSFQIAAALDDTVPPGSVFVPYAFPLAEIGRLGSPAGAGLRVKATRIPGAAPSHAGASPSRASGESHATATGPGVER